MSKKKVSEDFKQEDTVQAVVVVDDFNKTYASLVSTKSDALIPLINFPFLTYVLKCLSLSEVKEVFLCCTKYVDQIEQFVSDWSLKAGNCCDITVVYCDGCHSFGDVMREIDSKGFIRSDFVLMNGNLAANAQLQPLIKLHKERKKTVKDSVMTMIITKLCAKHMCLHKADEILTIVDNETKKLVEYCPKSQIHLYAGKPTPMGPGCEGSSVSNVNIDPQLAICTPMVPMLFTENFDWLTWQNFIRGVLDNEEILGNSIHCHLNEKFFALQASSLLAYDSTSILATKRWVFPAVPDQLNHLYKFKFRNTYVHRSAKLDRTTEIEACTVIGENAEIGANTEISDSVIGNNCIIGKNVVIENAYLWEGVVVGDNCKIKRTLIADGAKILSGVTMNKCVLSENVIIGSNKTLPDSTVLVSSTIAKTLPKNSYSVADCSLIGEDGSGFLYNAKATKQSECMDDADYFGDPFWDGDDEEEESPTCSEYNSDINFDPSSDEDEVDQGDDEETKAAANQSDFLEEVLSTLERALNEGIIAENLVLEVNSLEHAYNIQIKDVNILVTKAILKLPETLDTGVIKTNYFSKAKKYIHRFLKLFENYMKSEESQMQCLCAVESEATENPLVKVNISHVINELYQVDILSEDVILKWYETELSAERNPDIKEKMTRFVEWLQEAEEESDDESD